MALISQVPHLLLVDLSTGHSAPIRGALLAHMAPLAIAIAVASALSVLAGRRLISSSVAWYSTSRAQRGTTSLEFALALPVLLSMVFVTIQLTLWLNALLVVDYAAFSAA